MQILWLDIQLESGKKLHLPISLTVFQELLDCALDLTTLICLGIPKSSHLHPLAHASCDLIRMLIKLVASITKDGPYHLIDVAADNIKIAIKVK